jgi:hypothetical protein
VVIATGSASSNRSWEKAEVMVEIRKADMDPQAAATELLRIASAAEVKGNPACAAKASPNYCRDCSMVAVNGLLASLNKVKGEMWADQKHLTTQAGSVCSAAYPANRFGGASKCCFVKAGADVPTGFASCSHADSGGGATVGDRLQHTPALGYTLADPDPMISDCCEETSTCNTNDAKFAAALAKHVTKVNQVVAIIKGKQLKKDTVESEIKRLGADIKGQQLQKRSKDSELSSLSATLLAQAAAHQQLGTQTTAVRVTAMGVKIDKLVAQIDTLEKQRTALRLKFDRISKVVEDGTADLETLMSGVKLSTHARSMNAQRCRKFMQVMTRLAALMRAAGDDRNPSPPLPPSPNDRPLPPCTAVPRQRVPLHRAGLARRETGHRNRPARRVHPHSITPPDVQCRHQRCHGYRDQVQGRQVQLQLPH